MNKVVELVGGGSVINGAYLVKFLDILKSDLNLLFLEELKEGIVNN